MQLNTLKAISPTITVVRRIEAQEWEVHHYKLGQHKYQRTISFADREDVLFLLKQSPDTALVVEETSLGDYSIRTNELKYEYILGLSSGIYSLNKTYVANPEAGEDARVLRSLAAGHAKNIAQAEELTALLFGPTFEFDPLEPTEAPKVSSVLADKRFSLKELVDFAPYIGIIKPDSEMGTLVTTGTNFAEKGVGNGRDGLIALGCTLILEETAPDQYKIVYNAVPQAFLSGLREVIKYTENINNKSTANAATKLTRINKEFSARINMERARLGLEPIELTKTLKQGDSKLFVFPPAKPRAKESLGNSSGAR